MSENPGLINVHRHLQNLTDSSPNHQREAVSNLERSPARSLQATPATAPGHAQREPVSEASANLVPPPGRKVCDTCHGIGHVPHDGELIQKLQERRKPSSFTRQKPGKAPQGCRWVCCLCEGERGTATASNDLRTHLRNYHGFTRDEVIQVFSHRNRLALYEHFGPFTVAQAAANCLHVRGAWTERSQSSPRARRSDQQHRKKERRQPAPALEAPEAPFDLDEVMDMTPRSLTSNKSHSLKRGLASPSIYFSSVDPSLGGQFESLAPESLSPETYRYTNQYEIPIDENGSGSGITYMLNQHGDNASETPAPWTQYHVNPADTTYTCPPAASSAHPSEPNPSWQDASVLPEDGQQSFEEQCIQSFTPDSMCNSEYWRD